MGCGRRKGISRRQFLKRAAALGATALAQRLLGDGIVSVQGESGDVLPYKVYLPLVSNQRPGPVARGPSRLGLHTIKPNKSVDFVQAVHDAGAHVALVKALDDFGTLYWVKQASPETVTVGRWNGVVAVDPVGDPAEKAAWVMDQHMPRWEAEREVVDYWEVLNENDPPSIEGHVWLARFFIEAIDIAQANGYKLALFSYSTGVPQWHEWEAIVETGIFARAKEGGHALALHEYDWPVMDQRWGQPTEDLPAYDDRGVLAGRYRYLYRDFLIPRDEVIPLVITECGLDPLVGGPAGEGPWKERYVEEMIWYDTRLREDDYVLGAAMFTLGPTSTWSDYDYEELLWPGNPYGDNFLDYIVSLKDA